MYYSTMANCLNYAAYIPKHYCSLVGVSIRQNKLACRTPPGGARVVPPLLCCGPTLRPATPPPPPPPRRFVTNPPATMSTDRYTPDTNGNFP